ncbi:NUDIX hydrolase [Boudabousia liubingyangii]|uniref:NUDIX hydrolase n=1 Tax=Boudabousia liubingyangii TaxID=1921764 RepID=UPI0009FA9DA8|nr:NUDIX hydrolase [Boudabousia liubingyangii]
MSPTPAPRPSRIIRAGGALVWRPLNEGGGKGSDQANQPLSENQIEVLIVHRPRYDDWSWPKGKSEPGEHILSAAVREVEEETGLPIRLECPLLTQRYRLGSGQTKEVYYWIGRAEVAPGALLTRPPVARASSREIDEVRWVKATRARKLLTRRGDRRLLDDLISKLHNQQLETRTVILTRHGKAQSRDRWDGPDHERPLNRVGATQSLDLVELFSSYGINQLASSPYRRCLTTLAPYQGLAELAIEELPQLGEDEAAENPAQVSATLSQLIAKPGEPTVVCFHRPTQKDLVAALEEAADTPTRRTLKNQAEELKTAEMLVAHIAYPNGKPQVISVEKHRPRKLV